jgi:hypothetical protein
MDEMSWFLVGMGSFLSACFGFGYANNVADNHSVEALISKGVPALEAMCAIRPNKELCIGVVIKK